MLRTSIMAKKRNTPKLELTPELPQVGQEILIYFINLNVDHKIQQVKEFTSSLNNFVNGAGSSMVIVGEN